VSVLILIRTIGCVLSRRMSGREGNPSASFAAAGRVPTLAAVLTRNADISEAELLKRIKSGASDFRQAEHTLERPCAAPLYSAIPFSGRLQNVMGRVGDCCYEDAPGFKPPPQQAR